MLYTLPVSPGRDRAPAGPMCLLVGTACRRGVTHAGSNPGRGSHTQSPLMEHLSRACTRPRKIPRCPGWRSSSNPTLCAPGLLSPAQPWLWWEGAGGLRCWKGNLGPGQAGRAAESLERQPVPPAGPGEPEGWAEPGGRGGRRDQREVEPGVKFTHVPKGASRRAAHHTQRQVRHLWCCRAIPGNGAALRRANGPNARLRNQGGGGSPSLGTGPVTSPSRLCLALCGVQPPKRSPTWLRSGAGQGCMGP